MIYDYTITTGKGEEQKLSDLKGKVIAYRHERGSHAAIIGGGEPCFILKFSISRPVLVPQLQTPQ